MTTAVCPGSFDPVTLGHLDVIGRAAAVVDHLVVAVGRNSGKRSLFTVGERVAMLVEACAPFPGVSVEEFDGLLVDFCTARGATLICKGLRGAADTDYEDEGEGLTAGAEADADGVSSAGAAGSLGDATGAVACAEPVPLLTSSATTTSTRPAARSIEVLSVRRVTRAAPRCRADARRARSPAART